MNRVFMKQIIKISLKVPLSFFWYFKNRYYYSKSIRGGVYRQYVDPLIQNGYCVIGKYYGDVTFAEIVSEISEIKAQAELIKSGQEKGRIINPHLKSNLIARYVAYLSEIAVEYFGNRDIKVEMSLFQRSEPEKSLSEVPGGEGFHIDDGKKTLKFFLYCKRQINPT